MTQLEHFIFGLLFPSVYTLFATASDDSFIASHSLLFASWTLYIQPFLPEPTFFLSDNCLLYRAIGVTTLVNSDIKRAYTQHFIFGLLFPSVYTLFATASDDSFIASHSLLFASWNTIYSAIFTRAYILSIW